MGILSQINLVEILSSFIVLFVIIDVTGSIPIFLSLKSSDKSIKAGQACLVALLMFVGFFYAGDRLLDLFSDDVASFAVAGSFVSAGCGNKARRVFAEERYFLRYGKPSRR